MADGDGKEETRKRVESRKWKVESGKCVHGLMYPTVRAMIRMRFEWCSVRLTVDSWQLTVSEKRES